MIGSGWADFSVNFVVLDRRRDTGPNHEQESSLDFIIGQKWPVASWAGSCLNRIPAALNHS